MRGFYGTHLDMINEVGRRIDIATDKFLSKAVFTASTKISLIRLITFKFCINVARLYN